MNYKRIEREVRRQAGLGTLRGFAAQMPSGDSASDARSPAELFDEQVLGTMRSCGVTKRQAMRTLEGLDVRKYPFVDEVRGAVERVGG